MVKGLKIFIAAHFFEGAGDRDEALHHLLCGYHIDQERGSPQV